MKWEATASTTSGDASSEDDLTTLSQKTTLIASLTIRAMPWLMRSFNSKVSSKR